MDANQASYTLNLPMRQYMHLAVANILDNDIVSLADDGRCHPSKLRQTERDTINSHTTGLFTARQPMEVLEGVDQNFNVRLYMANCAAALVIDPRENKGRDIRVFTTGFATGFNICDSAYHFVDRAPYVRTTRLTEEEKTDKQAFCSVTFPSREPDTKAHGYDELVNYALKRGWYKPEDGAFDFQRAYQSEDSFGLEKNTHRHVSASRYVLASCSSSTVGCGMMVVWIPTMSIRWVSV